MTKPNITMSQLKEKDPDAYKLIEIILQEFSNRTPDFGMSKDIKLKMMMYLVDEGVINIIYDEEKEAYSLEVEDNFMSEILALDK